MSLRPLQRSRHADVCEDNLEPGFKSSRQGVMTIVISVLGLSVLHAPVVFSGWIGVNWVSPWNANNWAVTWEHGFVLRGFTGTALMAICGAISLKFILIISAAAVCLFLVLVTWMAVKLYLKSGNQEMLYVILFFLVQPCLVQWWLSPAMFARLDMFLVIAVLLSVITILSTAQWWGYVALLLIAIVAQLIHEGFGVLFVPTLFSCCLAVRMWNRPALDWKPALLYLLPALGVWLLIAAIGQPAMPFHDFVGAMKAHVVDFEVLGEDYVRPAYYMSFMQRVHAVLSTMTPDMVVRLALTVIFMIPSGWILTEMWVAIWRLRRSVRGQRLVLCILMIGTMSPLAAFILGCDFFRWIQYCVLNNIVLLGVLAYIDDTVRQLLCTIVRQRRWLVIAIIVISSSAGVPGVVTSYPFIEIIVQVIRRCTGL